MAFAPNDSPWAYPGMDAPEKEPGNNNPFLTCLNSGGAAAIPGNPPGVDQKALDRGLKQGGTLLVNKSVYYTGFVLAVSGLAVTTAGFALMVAGYTALGAAAVAGAPIAAAAAILGAGIVITVIGVGLFAVGIAAMIAAIDPPVLDFRTRVLPGPRRPITLPSEAPSVMTPMLQSFAELDYLASAHIEITDQANAAATQNDHDVWTDHLSDLYPVQSKMTKELNDLATQLNAFATSHAKQLRPHTIAGNQPLRNRATQVASARSLLLATGLTHADINLFLHQTRVPSSTQSLYEKSVNALIDEAGGEIAPLLQRVSSILDECDFLADGMFA